MRVYSRIGRGRENGKGENIGCVGKREETREVSRRNEPLANYEDTRLADNQSYDSCIACHHRQSRRG